ncbi:putative holin-like toxin [Clostridium simiarum]|nr:putative holin-like toxin [Clostridium simiarum]
MLLFQAGLFLLALLTFIVLLIDKISKIVVPQRININI